MLEKAILHKDELQVNYIKFLTTDRSLYYQASYRNYDLFYKNEEWDNTNFVSINKGSVIGMFNAFIDPKANIVTDISICSFNFVKEYDPIILSEDLNSFIYELFKRKYYSINWYVFNLNSKVLKLDRIFIKGFGIRGREIGAILNYSVDIYNNYMDKHIFQVEFRNPIDNSIYPEVKEHFNKYKKL